MWGEFVSKDLESNKKEGGFEMSTNNDKIFSKRIEGYEN